MNDDHLTNWRILMEKATAFLGQGDYKQAEKYYLRSLKLAKLLSVPEVLAFSIRLLSTSRIKQGKIEVAERGFREALQICQDIQNHKGMSEAMAGLASVAVALENYEEAAAWYEQAINIYPVNGPRLRLGMLFSDLGQVYSTLEDWTNARKVFTRARELCQIHGYRKGEGELSVLLAEVSYRQKDVDSARRDLHLACKIFVETDDEASLVNAIQYLAFIDFEEGRLERAHESWQRVVTLYMRLGQAEEIAESTYFLAKILQDLRNRLEAVVYLELSIQTYSRDDLGIGLRYDSLAHLQLMNKDYGAARDSFIKAAEIFEQYGEELKLSETYSNIAHASLLLGEKEVASVYQSKSKKSIENHQVYSLSTMQRLAEYFERRRSYLNALQYYWQSLKLAREIGLDPTEIERSIQRVSKRVRSKAR